MKTLISRVDTKTVNLDEVRSWAEALFTDSWYYLEVGVSQSWIVCFNALRDDPEHIETIAALRWA